MVQIEVPQAGAEKHKRTALPVIGRIFLVIILLAVVAMSGLAYLQQGVIRETVGALELIIAKNAADVDVLMAQNQERGSRYQELNSDISRLDKELSGKLRDAQKTLDAIEEQNKKLSKVIGDVQNDISTIRKEIYLEY